MTKKKQKLELTWIGKEKRPRLEPRILLEDKTLSYHAEAQKTKEVSNADLFAEQENEQTQPFDDNLLIQGDNLLALKALEHQYAGKVKCVFIDPPYNVPIAGHVCGLGSIQHPDFAMASGEMYSNGSDRR